MKHHAQLAGGLSDPRDVGPRDEGTRVSGERSTTPNLREAHPTLETWCPATKGQGGAGSGAPRLLSRRLHHSGGAPHSPPAEASSKPAPAPPGGQPTYAPSGSAAIAKPVNQKTGAARGQSLFLSAFAILRLRRIPLLFLILRLRRIPFAVCNPAAVQDSFPS